MDTLTELRGHASREVVIGMTGRGDGIDPNPEVTEQGTRRRLSAEYTQSRATPVKVAPGVAPIVIAW